MDGTTGKAISYAHLGHMVGRLAGGLAAIGLRPGDVLGLFSPNTVLYPVVFHAAVRAGATVTTVNSLSTAKDVANQLGDSRARYLVTISAFLDRTTEAAAVEEVFVCDAAEGYRSIHDLMALGAEPTKWRSTRRSTSPSCRTRAAPERPRGSCSPTATWSPTSPRQSNTLALSPDDRVIAVLPFFHIYGLTVLMNIALASGATLVTLPKFDLADFLRTIQDQRITVAFVAPPIVVALAKHPMVSEYDLSSLRFMLSGAAPLDADLATACAQRLGWRARSSRGTA